jgi:hypothetical protein
MPAQIIDIGEYKIRKGLAPAPKLVPQPLPNNPSDTFVQHFLQPEALKNLFTTTVKRPNT